MARLRTTGTSYDAIDKMLGRLPLEMRTKIIKKAMKKPVNILKKAYRKTLPKGDPEHSPDKRQLHRLVGNKIYEPVQGLFLSYTGVRTYPDGEGWYAGFVERGFKHRGGAWVPGKEPLKRAVQQTEQQRHQEIITGLAQIIIEAGG